MEKENPMSVAEKVAAVLSQRASGETLSCREAFEVVSEMGVDPATVGAAADRRDIRLVRCQLGLFGYGETKKIVIPRDPETPGLLQAIRQEQVENRLPCRTAWALAERFGVPRLTLGCACEYLGVKIKPCQLGAF